MFEPNTIIPNAKVRAWIYGVLVAAGPLAVFYGLATQEEVALWLGVAASALGNGLALANTPVRHHIEE